MPTTNGNIHGFRHTQVPLYATFVAISMKTICDTISCVLHRCAPALDALARAIMRSCTGCARVGYYALVHWMRSRGLLCARALDALPRAIMRSCTGCARAGNNALGALDALAQVKMRSST